MNGKRYIGSAVNLRKRWLNHRHLLQNNRHHNRHLQSSWNKHGEQAFTFVILERCEREQLVDHEQVAIDLLKPELNICLIAGSTLGVKTWLGRSHASASKLKMAELAKGRVISIGQRAKLSIALRGRRLPDEQKAKMSAVAKGRKKSPETRARMAEAARGRKMSVEAVEKMAASKRGKRISAEHKARLHAGIKIYWARRCAAKEGVPSQT